MLWIRGFPIHNQMLDDILYGKYYFLIEATRRAAARATMLMDGFLDLETTFRLEVFFAVFFVAFLAVFFAFLALAMLWSPFSVKQHFHSYTKKVKILLTSAYFQSGQ